MGINVVSLFDGISCGRLALERANIEVNNYYASEIESGCIDLVQKHFPNTIQLGDVTKIDEKVLKSLPKIDLLIGGSPCTNLSRNGNGQGLKGEQSKLFFEYARILEWLKNHNNPDIKFLLENVEMKKNNAKIISKILGEQPVPINSKLLSAQNRPRLYWSNLNISVPQDKNVTLKDVLIDIDIDLVEKEGLFFDQKLSQKSIDLVFIDNGNVAIKQKSCTLDRQCECCVLDGNVIRKLHINELELLQTLPINYTDGFSERERKSMIGNCWTVDVIAHIFLEIKD